MGEGWGGSENTSLTLQPPDILNDLIDIIGRHAVDLRHIAKVPMVRPNSIERGALERDIGMVVWFVDLMHQRRPLRSPDRSRAMTGRAMGGKFRFSGLKLGRNGSGCRRSRLFVGLRFTGGAERQEGEAGCLDGQATRETAHQFIFLAEVRPTMSCRERHQIGLAASASFV